MKRLFSNRALWYPEEDIQGTVLEEIEHDDNEVRNDISGADEILEDDEFGSDPDNDSDAIDAINQIARDIGEAPEEIAELDERRRDEDDDKPTRRQRDDEDEEDADPNPESGGETDSDGDIALDPELVEYAKMRGKTPAQLEAMVKKHGPEMAQEIIAEGFGSFLGEMQAFAEGAVGGDASDPFSATKPAAPAQPAEQPAEQTTETGKTKPATAAGITLDDSLVEKVRAEAGDAVADDIVKPLVETVNAMQGQMAQVQNYVRAQQEQLLWSQIETAIDGVSVNFRDRFGQSMTASTEQLQERAALVRMADGIMSAKSQAGVKLTVEQAVKAAFFVRVGPEIVKRAAKGARDEVETKAERRARNVSLSPRSGTRRTVRKSTRAAEDAVSKILNDG